MSDIIRREALRDSYCRGCDKKVLKGEDIIYTYTFRNRGQIIIFCLDCAGLIGSLSEMYKVDNNLTREEKREFIISKAGEEV